MAYPNLKRLMLIYGHTPTPPATLTQEQLARDAGQLVQAHAALDKLVSDTDRSANSLLDRIQQVVNCTEQVNKVLDSAGLPKNASIVESVETLKRRCEHHAKTCEERGIKVGRLAAQIHDLKDRNKRLHDAQAGSGNSAAADLADIRKLLLSSFPGKTFEEAAIALGGITTEGVVEQLVVALKRQQPNPISEQVLDRFHRAVGALSCAGLPGDTLEVDKRVEHLIAENKRLRGQLQEAGDVLNKELAITKGGSLPVRIQRLIDCVREGNGKDPALDRLVRQAHQALHDAGVEPRLGNLIERVRSLVEERDRLKNDVGYRPLYDMVQRAHRKLDDAGFTTRDDLNIEQRVERMIAENREQHRRLESQANLILGSGELLDRAGIPSGALPERVRVAIERGQQPISYVVSPTLDEKAWEVRNRDNRVMATCASLADAQRIRAALEAR